MKNRLKKKKLSPLNNKDDLFRVNHTKLCMKECSNEILNDNQDENEKDKDTDRPINIIKSWGN